MKELKFTQQQLRPLTSYYYLEQETYYHDHVTALSPRTASFFDSQLLGHMCFSCYRTYVMLIGLSFDNMHLYFRRLRMCLNASRNHVSKSSVEAFKSIQEIKQGCKFIKTRKLVDSCSTPPICRGLRISYFNSDFLGIRESVYELFFLLILDI